MNLGKIKFEKINMKIVIAIGICVIALLTAAFIIFRTNLIINHGEKEKPDTQENEKDNGNKDSEDNDEEEQPEEPGTDNDKDNETEDDKEDDKKEEPNYDDPEEEDENAISKDVINRTKKAENLTVVEKEYIVKENMNKFISSNKTMKKTCVKDSFCSLDVEKYTDYSNDKKIGKKVKGCSGRVVFYYNSKKKEFVYDYQELKCK